MTASDRTPEMAKRERIIREMTDDLDEELEMELDDARLDELLDETDAVGPTVDRRLYFRELLRLQGELVKLQDWVQSEKKKVVVLFEGATPPARAASSSASPSASIPASAASRRCRRRASASARNGISSAMSRTCPQAARWCCSTAVGTIAPASSA